MFLAFMSRNRDLSRYTAHKWKYEKLRFRREHETASPVTKARQNVPTPSRIDSRNSTMPDSGPPTAIDADNYTLIDEVAPGHRLVAPENALHPAILRDNKRRPR